MILLLLNVYLRLILILLRFLKDSVQVIPKIVRPSYLNVKAIRNKFENLQEIINQDVDVLAVAGTKTDSSNPSVQFFLTDILVSVDLISLARVAVY